MLFMALIFCSSFALGQTNDTTVNEFNASALQALVGASYDTLESYRFSVETEHIIDLVNFSSGDLKTRYLRSSGCGLVNTSDGALRQSMVELMYAKGDEENASARAWEEYLINETFCSKENGNWTATQMLGMKGAWSQQSAMAQQLKTFNQSSISLIGSEMVDGQDCYKVRSETDMNYLIERLSREEESLPPLLGMNLHELIRNISIDSCYWITKDTHLLKKTEAFVIFAATPQSLGLIGNVPEGEDMHAEFSLSGGSSIGFTIADGQGIRTKSRVSMLFYGFNESAKIILPDEAKDAQSHLQDLFPPMMKAISTVIDRNETGLNETR
jgi:hypothetical protein